MPFYLDPVKIFVILAVALVILGPERLPQFARTLGSLWRDFNTYREKVINEVKQAIPDTSGLTEPLQALQSLARPSSLITSTLLSTSVSQSPKEQISQVNETQLAKANLRKMSELLGEGNPVWLPEDPRLN